VIENGHENGRGQGYDGRAIAGIVGHRDLQYRRSGVVWVKMNGYRGAGAHVSENDLENRRGVWRCGCGVAP
jgi:hypothetical protein